MQLSKEHAKLIDELLECVEYDPASPTQKKVHKALEALDGLRAQADARPVALRVRATPADKWVVVDADGRAQSFAKLGWETEPLYTHPEASAPGLSDDERQAIEHAIQRLDFHRAPEKFLDRLRAILTRASAATVAEPSEIGPRGRPKITDLAEDGQFMRAHRAAEAEAAQQRADPRNEARHRFDETTERLLKEQSGFAAEVAKIGKQAEPCAEEAMCPSCYYGGSKESCVGKQAEPGAYERAASDAYDKVDRFLRNNLDDVDYAEYSEALECVRAAQQKAEPGAAEREEAGSLIGDGFVLEFERWNDVTGALPRNGSWLAEVSDIIQRAAQSGQRAGVAEGWQLVPIHPTKTMLDAIAKAVSDGFVDGMVWRKALAAAQSGQRAGVDEDARDAVRMRFLIEGNHALISCICHDPVEHYEWSVTGIPCGWHRTQREAIDDAMGCAAPTQQQGGS